MGELVVYTPEKTTGQALCKLLARRHFYPQYFQSTEDLFNKLRFGYSGIIILDLSSLPRIDRELENILELAEEIPIIMATPYRVEEEELDRFHRRGYHIIEKPICIPTLVALLRSL